MNNSFEFLIVGSGMGATGAALALAQKSKSVACIDLGLVPEQNTKHPEQSVGEMNPTDRAKLMLGNNFDGLHLFCAPDSYLPPRLASPKFRFVTESMDQLCPTQTTKFHFVQSGAKGGLANAWGAGAYRYNDRDLLGFPLAASDLESAYDAITAEMGISGSSDDLDSYFGSIKNLQPSLRLTENASKVLECYGKNKPWFQSRGVTLGRSRLAILSQWLHGRRSFQNQNLEYWSPLPEIYSPRYTMDRLIGESKIEYRGSLKVEKIKQHDDHVIIQCRHILDHKIVTFRARKVMLAAGAINSARIVLNSLELKGATLPLLENPMYQIPGLIMSPFHSGKMSQNSSFSLNMVYELARDRKGDIAQSGFMDVSSISWAELFGNLPLPASFQLSALHFIAPRLMVNILFFSSDFQNPAQLRMDEAGRLSIQGHAHHVDSEPLHTVISSMRKLGLYTFRWLARVTPPGGSIHYAGSLPMSANPQKWYETNSLGQLQAWPGVHIVDAALFPRLPAKNHSMTIMANALRIARHIKA